MTATLVRSTTRLTRAVLANPLPTLADDPGGFHQMLSQLDTLVRRAREEIRERVRAGEVIERPDGKVLTITHINVERLSKKSIMAALGSTKGEELLSLLRAAGALTENEEERMIAK
jgi:hypothetical protein